MVPVSLAYILFALAAFLGGIAVLAIDPRVVDMADLPADISGFCLFAQPLAADSTMRFSRRFIFLHIHSSFKDRSAAITVFPLLSSVPGNTAPHHAENTLP
jgi:hypothetical protein